MPDFSVRVGIGNGTLQQRVVVTASNQAQAQRAAAAQTGGKALGAYQVPSKK